MSATAVRITISSVAILAACLCSAQHAESQTTRSRQIGPAVFGGTGTRADQPGGLDLSAQLFTSYDDNVLADERRRGNEGSRTASAEGFYSGLSIGLQYAHLGPSTQFRVYTDNSVNHYPDLDMITSYHQAGATLTSQLGRRYSIRVSPFAAYSPHYSMRLFLAPLPVNPDGGGSLDGPALAAPDVDSTILQRESVRYGGNAELEVLAARHSTVIFRYGYTKTDFTNDSPGDRTGDFDVQTIGARLRHEISRSASLTFGYALQESTFQGSTTPLSRTQNLIIGVDYRKPLSRSRRTFLQFNTGSVITNQVEPDQVATDQGDERHIRATGSAMLVHQMGRTWNTRAQYRRQVGYLEGFARPVFTDTATFAVGGLLTRRADLFVNVNYITGTSAAQARLTTVRQLLRLGAGAARVHPKPGRVFASISSIITTSTMRPIGPSVCHSRSVVTECGWG